MLTRELSERLTDTLGGLIKKFQLALTINNSDVILEDARKARNWLAHHSIRENWELMVAHDGKKELASRIAGAGANVWKAIRLLDPIQDSLFERVGYTKELRSKDREMMNKFLLAGKD